MLRYFSIQSAFAIILIVGSTFLLRNISKNEAAKNHLKIVEYIQNKNCVYKIDKFRFDMTREEFENLFPKSEWEFEGDKSYGNYIYSGSFNFFNHSPEKIYLDFEKGVLSRLYFFIDVSGEEEFYSIIKNFMGYAIIHESFLYDKMDKNKEYGRTVRFVLNDCHNLEIEYENSPKHGNDISVSIFQNFGFKIDSN